MSKDRKRLIMLLSCIILVLSFALIYLNTDLFKKTEVGNAIDSSVSDNIRFYRDYPSVDMENNIYYYATYDEIVEVLTKGTGIVFFGFLRVLIVKRMYQCLMKLQEKETYKKYII